METFSIEKNCRNFQVVEHPDEWIDQCALFCRDCEFLMWLPGLSGALFDQSYKRNEHVRLAAMEHAMGILFHSPLPYYEGNGPCSPHQPAEAHWDNPNNPFRLDRQHDLIKRIKEQNREWEKTQGISNEF